MQITYIYDLLIRRARQAVVEHSETFVLPQSDELPGGIKPIGCAQAQSLGYTGQIPQIENVVKFRRCRW